MHYISNLQIPIRFSSSVFLICGVWGVPMAPSGDFVLSGGIETSVALLAVLFIRSNLSWQSCRQRVQSSASALEDIDRQSLSKADARTPTWSLYKAGAEGARLVLSPCGRSCLPCGQALPVAVFQRGCRRLHPPSAALPRELPLGLCAG